MRWLEQGRHGAMDYMQRHGRRRARPQELIPGTLRVIAARMDYLPPQARDADEVLGDAERGYVSRYALGRDYHKVLRGRLAQLAEKIRAHSAIALASRVRRQRPDAGEGVRARRRARLDRQAHESAQSQRRLVVLPRRDPHRPAAAGRRAGDQSLRHLPRVHRRLPDRRDRRALRARCDALHLLSHDRAAHRDSRSSSARPWATASTAATTASWCAPGTSSRASPRRATSRRATVWTTRTLVELFAWSEEEFLARTEGSAIRRIGYECWLRNIAVALGNAPTTRGGRCRRSRHGATIRRRWCASTCSGRWTSMGMSG